MWQFGQTIDGEVIALLGLEHTIKKFEHTTSPTNVHCYCLYLILLQKIRVRVRVMVFNTTFKNISVKSW